MISEPIFLVGAERSGTTVLRLMLTHHPQIAWCQEFEYAVDRVADDGNFPNLEEYYEWLETNRVFQATGFAIDPSLNYPELVNSFLEQQRDRQNQQIIGATLHRHYERLVKIWPNARFIHLIRDGRDVANSCIGMGWAGNVWTGVERWLVAEQLWGRLKGLLSASRYFEVTYEQLISDPEATLTSICNFIGLPYNQAMLSYPQTTTYEFPDPKFIQQWRSKLSEHEIQLVESRIGQMLTERGYELSLLPSLKVPPMMELKLKLQDKWERFQFRLRRYGLPLFVSDYLSRRFGRKEWQKQIKLQLNAIDKKYLK
ncbi:MAG: sulfotransferase [Gomphosphaeria aponina SAG 52.96 = DSM 107014]|uniref:Sulfotransferase n=1 Tax=Gomphosphaeria aponina SAG 52.96 = DSM 107014 TaxID=1521640 RepID=A0A941JV27_9CHRO|nr:sulfotransferase [Gomphosphaeria aponina SAG 52.96 = DSM 107014]